MRLNQCPIPLTVLETGGKMDTYLTRRLLKEFTKAGDVILDPMAGVGTTGIEAVLLGRHCIMVDIEEKFSQLMEKNLRNVKKIFGKSSFKLKLGRAVVITGDARKLSELIKENADAIVTSPPYSNAISKQGGETTVKNVGVSTITARRYSANPKNIGNLPEGVIDTVLTSPPYSEQLQAKADYEKRKERLKRAGHTKATHGLLRGQKSSSKVIGGDERYSDNPENIGNLQHGKLNNLVRKKGNQKIIPRKLLENLYLERKLTMRQIAAIIGVCRLHVHHSLKEYGIKPLKRWQRHDLHLSRKQWEILVGTIFGDTSIRKKKTETHYRLSCSHSEKDREYLLWKVAELQNLFLPNIVKYDNGYGPQLSCYSFSHPFFSALRKIFYPSGKKILPKHIIQHISPLSIAVWFMDDGSLHLDNRDGVYSFRIATYCYTKKELSKVVKILKDKFNLIASVDKDNVVYISRHSTNAFANLISSYIIPCMSYKLPPLSRMRIDSIITSPPYGESMSKKRKGYTIIPQLEHTRELPQETKDENIGNLPHGKVDTIITSPPYADIHQCPTSTGWTEFFRRQLEEKGYIEWNGERYTEEQWRAMNHGRLDGRSTRGMKKDAKYSENPSNIGNLPLEGSVDTIITSPPYEATFNVKQHTLSGIAKRDPNYRREVGGYGQSEANIGNLRRGKESVDTIITSPPYQHALHDTLEKRKKWKEKGMHEEKKGLPLGYSEKDENIGNIKEHGNVADVIITSPPYGHDSVVHKNRSGETKVAKEKLGYADFYSSSDKNIGNLKHGEEEVEAKEKTETYLEAMLKCYSEMFKVLKPSGLCIIVLKNFIRNFRVVNLVGDTVKLCQFIGFKLEKKIKFKLPTKSFWRILYQKKWEEKFKEPFPEEEFASVYEFETCLVFRKV